MGVLSRPYRSTEPFVFSVLISDMMFVAFGFYDFSVACAHWVLWKKKKSHKVCDSFSGDISIHILIFVCLRAKLWEIFKLTRACLTFFLFVHSFNAECYRHYTRLLSSFYDDPALNSHSLSSREEAESFHKVFFSFASMSPRFALFYDTTDTNPKHDMENRNEKDIFFCVEKTMI